MPPALSARDWCWGAGWLVGLGAACATLAGFSGLQLVAYCVQYLLLAGAMMLPGLLLLGGRPRRSRLPLRWRLVVVLGLAAALAIGPWVSPDVGCPEC